MAKACQRLALGVVSAVRLPRVLMCLFWSASVIAVGGCGLLPATGPASWDVRAGQHDSQALPYVLVAVTPAVIDILAHATPRLATAFTDQRPPNVLRFGVGDVLSVTIFEAVAGGLFSPSEATNRPGNFVTLPSQEVDEDGNITIPFAGQVRAKNRTKIQVQQAIALALKDRAIEPQVVVTVADQHSSLINILGDVRSPGRLPALRSGEHILEVITRVGGTSGPGSDEWVLLERNGRRAVAPFGALVYEPVNNIWAHPDDIIYVFREPQTYLALGATGTQSQIPFDAWRLSLAEAVAKAGGLNDGAADPASVFLYRGETRELAEKLGIDCSHFPGPIIPVIYNLNVRDPAAYFLATKFEMRSKDIIYISNSVSVEVNKFLSFLESINAAVQAPISTAVSVISLKSILAGTGAAPSILIGPTTSGH
jgi:polysaccharide export outer membrane protein